MEPRWCDRPFPGWLADPDCVWFCRTDRAIECVDLHGDFGLLGLECASVELAAVERNVKCWRNAEMALRWTAAGLLEAQKTFRRLKAYRQLPVLDAALREAVRKAGAKSVIEDIEVAA